MNTFKNIARIAILEIAMVCICYVLLLVVKILGITGGKITQLIPFLVIFLVTIIVSKMEKCKLDEIGIVFNKESIIIGLIFALLAVFPCFFGTIEYISIGSACWNLGYYLIVGVAEELFFRGYIKTRFTQENHWIWRSVSAVAFASLHFISSEEMTAVLFILLVSFGIVFALLRDWLGTIVPLIIFHSLWDFWGCYSENYSNVFWMFVAWIVMLIVAYIFRKQKEKIIARK